MDMLQVAEQNILVSVIVVFCIGVIHGAVLGRGIRRRFPRLKAHARAVSVILLVLFSINALASTIKFAIPDKMPISDFVLPSTLDQGIEFIIIILGLNAGFGAVLALFVSISLVVIFRHADLPDIARYFVFLLGAAMMGLAVLGRFTDYVPEFFEIAMYAGYQFGITIGIFVVTARRGRLDEES